MSILDKWVKNALKSPKSVDKTPLILRKKLFRLKKIIWCTLVLSSVFTYSSAQKGSLIFDKTDPFLEKRYWELHKTPMQERIRSLKPLPVSVVYAQQEDDNSQKMQAQFKKISQLGFSGLKQIMLMGDNASPIGKEKVFNAVLDENISPWYYGMGGWDPITPELLSRLGIIKPYNKQTAFEIQRMPAMLNYQNTMLRKRILNMKNVPAPDKSIQMGEPGRGNPFMAERLVPLFANWLEKKYGSLQKLSDAWAIGYTERVPFESFLAAASEMKGHGFDEFGRGTGKLSWDFVRYRDAMRFQADLMVGDYYRVMDHYTKYEPNEPKRTGAHQLFENQALNGWDFDGQAAAAANGGSFYASIHLAHHFFLTEGEIMNAAYIQARMVNDHFKGGWAATWESTGGPTQWSGTHSFMVDSAIVKRLMLSYLAAGLKGIGFWTWNSRDKGWEMGEYALTDLQGEPGPRALAAARVARACDKERIDLWDALDQPAVGVLYSWENEALLGRLSLGSYPLATKAYPHDRDPEFAQYYSQARIGISNELMERNIPFEYVSEAELLKGLIGRYKTLILPCMVVLKDSTLQLLKNYVESGGNLIADMPLLLAQENGNLNKWKKGSLSEQVFGFQVGDYQNYFNHPLGTLLGLDKGMGQFGELKLTNARYVENTNPGIEKGITQNKLGNGQAWVLNFEASRALFKGKPSLGTDGKAQDLAKNTWAIALKQLVTTPFTSSNPKIRVFRRASPECDYYFLMNDGNNSESTTVTTTGIRYQDVLNCLADGSKISLSSGNLLHVNIGPRGSAWIKCKK